MARIEHDAPGLDAALRSALLDPHRSMRALARFYLHKRLGDAAPDAAAAYRELLAVARHPHRTVTALDGLGETGQPADAASIRPFLFALRPSVRASALRSVAALDPDACAGAVVAALDDPSPRVARMAARLVMQGVAGVDAETVFAPRLASEQAHVRRNALDGVGALPYWTALPHLLQAAASADGSVADEATQRIERWVSRASRVFTGPPARVVAAVRESLGADPLPAALAGRGASRRGSAPSVIQPVVSVAALARSSASCLSVTGEGDVGSEPFYLTEAPVESRPSPRPSPGGRGRWI